MKLRQLEQFIAVCETGSISRASAQLRIAQPALGLQIRQLEDAFESQLLIRHPRGVRPTAAGEIVLAWARDTLERARAVKHRVLSLETPAEIVLSLGMCPSISSLLTDRLLARALHALPMLKLRIVDEWSHVLAEWIGEQRLDLALLFDYEVQAPADSKIIARENLHFVTARANAPLLPSHLGTIAFRDALAWPLAMPSSIGTVRRAVENAARQLNLQPQVVSEIHSMDVVSDMVRRGEVSAIIPSSFVRRDIDQGHIISLLIVEPMLTRNLLMARSAAHSQAVHIDALEELILAELQAACADSASACGYHFPVATAG